MRQALNQNPVVQVVMLGALGIIVAFLFMTRVMGQDDTGGAAAPAATPAPTTAGAAPAPTTAAPSAPAPPTPAADPAATTQQAGFEAGAGLPASLVNAHDSGDVVVLLVVNRQGTEDDRLESEVRDLSGRGDTSVFVIQAKDVADYSRIAEGVNLDRVPALVVIEPKGRAKGELPTASISYGFRGPASVEQAVRDALYKGRELPYHPG